MMDRESRKQWDDAAVTIARAVVGVMPHMDENRIRARVFQFFASESEYSGSAYSDVNYYYIEDVCNVLEGAFDSADDDSRMNVQSDFRWAFDQLSDAYQYRILERYQHQVVRPADSPERAQLNRATRKLLEILNTWNKGRNHDGPGSREVWSNARAREEIGRPSADRSDPFGAF